MQLPQNVPVGSSPGWHAPGAAISANLRRRHLSRLRCAGGIGHVPHWSHHLLGLEGVRGLPEHCKGGPELLPLFQPPAPVAAPDMVHARATEGTELETLESNQEHLELRRDSQHVNGTIGREPGNPEAWATRPDPEQVTPPRTWRFPNISSSRCASSLLCSVSFHCVPHSWPRHTAAHPGQQVGAQAPRQSQMLKNGRDKCVRAGEAKSPLFLRLL